MRSRTLIVPGINYQIAIHPHAHAIIRSSGEDVSGTVKGEAALPAHREVISAYAVAWAITAPIEVDAAIIPGKGGTATQPLVVVVFSTELPAWNVTVRNNLAYHLH